MTKRYNKVLDIINKRLIPDVDAKKARGEVFTPLPLVQEMLLGIRRSAIQKGVVEIWGLNEEGEYVEDDEEDRVGGIPLDILRDSETKWLDPANGIGNFPVVAFYILDFQIGQYGKKEFRGLENRDKRQNHIVQNMLYMIELNKGNINASIKIFKLIAPDVKPNICCADTLEMTDEKLIEVFGVNRFDVVMGNPPYNEGGTRTSGEKGIYKKFILHGFEHLSKEGCLVFIHPPNFHRIDKDEKKKVMVKKIFNENRLLFLRLLPDTKIHFNVQIDIDYYVLQKGANHHETEILDKHNVLTSNLDISEFSVVPNFGFGIIEKIKQHLNKGSFLPAVSKSSTVDTRSVYDDQPSHGARGKYKVIHLIVDDGIRVFMSEKPHKYQHVKKVIVNGMGVPYVFEDKEGIYGISGVSYYILSPSKKDKIFLFSHLFQYIINAFKLQGTNNELFLFHILPDLNKLDFKDETTMLSYFGFTEKEKEEIMDEKIPIFIQKEKLFVPKSGKTKKAFKGGTKTRKVRR